MTLVSGTLGMILRSSKRLYMRIYYSLVDGMRRYFTLKTINFTSMDEDKGTVPHFTKASLQYNTRYTHAQTPRAEIEVWH